MADQHHRIFRLKIDLSLPPDEKPNPVQDRISSLLKTSLYQKIDRVFSTFNDSKFHLKLDHLEVDLGKIALNRLETDFPEKMEKELKTALQKLRQQHVPKQIQKKQEGPAMSTALEVLSFFLGKGSFPWWLPKHMPKDPIQLFYQIISKEADQLTAVIGNFIGSEWPRKRLVHTFEDKEIKQVIQLLDPINAEIIIAYNEKLVKQHEKEALVKIGRQEFKKAGWEVILKYLFEKRGSEFNQRNFLRRMLIGLAARFNITYSELLEKLAAIATRFTASDRVETSLLKNIIFLAQEEKSKPIISASIAKTELTNEREHISKDQRKVAVDTFQELMETTNIRQEITKSHLDKQLELFQQLWAANRYKAIRFVKHLVLKDQTNHPLIMRLPKTLFKEVLLQVQPAHSPEFWQLREDLVRLVQHLPEWNNTRVNTFVNQYLLVFAIRSAGNWQDVSAILKALLKNIALESNKTFEELIQFLFTSINQKKPPILLQSKLLVYLHQFLATHQHTFTLMDLKDSKFGLAEEERPISKDWQFYPTKETISEYLKRIKKQIRQKELHTSIQSVFTQPMYRKKWLPLMVKQWTPIHRMELFKLLWPGLTTFFKYWATDAFRLIRQYGLQRKIATLNQWEVELIIWEVLMGAGVGGQNKVNLINQSLLAVANQLNLTKTSFFHTIYTLSKAFAQELTLKGSLATLIARAIQQNLFIDPLPTTVTNNESDKAAIKVTFAELTQFFTTGVLPIGRTTEELRLIIEQQILKNPLALRFWLENIIEKADSLERLTLFFSKATQVQLMNVLEPNTGQIALEILSLIKELDKDLLKGTKQKKYWIWVWQTLKENQQKGFQIRHYFLAIIKIVAVNLQLDSYTLLEKLTKISNQISPTHSFVGSLLQIAYHLNIPKHATINHEEEITKVHTNFAFAKMTTVQLRNWITGYLVAGQSATFLASPIAKKILDFGNFVYQLPIKKQTELWQMLSDQTVFTFFQNITNPDEFNAVLDVVEVISVVKRKKQYANTRLFSSELSLLLLNAIFDQRGSIANQKAFATKLFKDWATAHNMTYSALMELLWPIVQALTPIFNHHASVTIFSKLIQSELGEAFVTLVSPPEKAAKKPTKEEEKSYKKLWDMEEKTLVIEQDWVVHNAGLLLLWPYFNPLFERAGLMENSQFLDEIAQQKGILLLEYLASGMKEAPEHQLVLNKVFCGYPVEAPITIQFQLEEGIQELCEGLLQAAIHHWESIGETSVPTFRETFLLRSGTLARTEKHWQLKVNSKAYDVLIRQLPWGITTINLSWMDKVMKVDWE